MGTYLFRRKNRNVVFIDDPGLLFNNGLVSFFLQFLTRHPEEHIFLTELRSEEFPEGVPPRRSEHHLVK